MSTTLLSRMATFRRLLPMLAALLLAAAAFAAPKNVILMIGDGMGPDVVMAAAAYQFGADSISFGGTKKLAMQTLTGHCFVTTYSTGGKGYDFAWANGNKEYVKAGATDSAAAATAMSTGQKTYDAAISVNKDKQPLRTITEAAKGAGMKTGIITTVPISHATPACFGAHNENRNNYQAIAHEMLFTMQPDVVMGAGNPDDGPKDKPYTYIAEADWQALKDGKTPYTLLQSREDFQQLIKKPAPGKVLGMFHANGNLAYRGADGKAANPALPTLAEMARGALGTLDNPKGFFLMVEGGAIDYAGHANDLNANVGETLGFDVAIQAVLDWIAAHGGWEQNLLIITADHDTGYLNSVKPAEPGKLPAAIWGTDGKWGGHTNRLVDVYYQGAMSDTLTTLTKPAKDFARGEIRYIDNTAIHQAMLGAFAQKNAPAMPEVSVTEY